MSLHAAILTAAGDLEAAVRAEEQEERALAGDWSPMPWNRAANDDVLIEASEPLRIRSGDSGIAWLPAKAG